jgi:hypothetical protein
MELTTLADTDHNDGERREDITSFLNPRTQALRRSNEAISYRYNSIKTLTVVDDPEYIKKIEDALSLSKKTGLPLLQYCKEHGVSLRVVESTDPDYFEKNGAATASYDTLTSRITLVKNEKAFIEELAGDLGHELRHGWQYINFGEELRGFEKQSKLLTIKIVEADAAAVSAKIKDEILEALGFSVVDESKFSKVFGPNPTALTEFTSFLDHAEASTLSQYEIQYIHEVAGQEACGRWRHIIETIPLLKPEFLARLTRMPDGSPYLPQEFMPRIAEMAAQVALPSVQTPAKRPLETGTSPPSVPAL